jgi:hypothetical protein
MYETDGILMKQINRAQSKSCERGQRGGRRRVGTEDEIYLMVKRSVTSVMKQSVLTKDSCYQTGCAC